jgi:hypothetical protein
MASCKFATDSVKKTTEYQAIGEGKILQFIRPQTWNNSIIETVIGHIFGIFYPVLVWIGYKQRE